MWRMQRIELNGEEETLWLTPYQRDPQPEGERERVREVMNNDKLNIVLSLSLSSSSYSAPTALGIRQEVERIRDNVFYLTF